MNIHLTILALRNWVTGLVLASMLATSYAGAIDSKKHTELSSTVQMQMQDVVQIFTLNCRYCRNVEKLIGPFRSKIRLRY